MKSKACEHLDSIHHGKSRQIPPGRVTLLAVAAAISTATAALGAGETLIIAATGGEAIRAETAGGAWTELAGPTIDESYARDIGYQATGTIILTAPDGFEFNPNASVNVRVGGLGPKPINGLPEGSLIPVTVTDRTLTVNITSESRGGKAYPGYLIWEGIQVRPLASAPLLAGELSRSGSCNFRNLVLASGTWGRLQMVGGSVAGYVLSGPENLTAGAPVTIVIQKVDSYGNPVPVSSTETLVFTGLESINSFLPTVNGSTDAFLTGISVAFDENGRAVVSVVAYSAGSGTLAVTDRSGISSQQGGGLALHISAGLPAQFSLVLSHDNISYGGAVEVTLQTRDAFGNLSTAGLPESLLVTLGIAGEQELPGSSLTQDIGSAAGNGEASFGNVQFPKAGENTLVAVTPTGLVGSLLVHVDPLPVSAIVKVADKVYDGSTSASVTEALLTGTLSGDELTLLCNGSAHFMNKHVGTEKPVLVSGLALAGADAPNYYLTTDTLTTTASIFPKRLIVRPAEDKKTYDGTPHSRKAPAVPDLAPGDRADVMQHFVDKVSGEPKTLVPRGEVEDGNNGQNYEVAWKDDANGAIEPRPLTIVASAATKVYDGTRAATVSFSDDRLPGDNLLIRFTNAAFTTADAGSDKDVIVSGITLEGTDAQNYIAPVSVTSRGSILPAPLTVRADNQRRECGTPNPELTGTLEGVLGSDMFTVSFTTVAHPGSGVGTYTIQPEIQDPGQRLGNYQLTIWPGVLSVVPAASEITILPSAYPALAGSNLTFTVVIDAASQGGTSPTGTIRLLVNDQMVGGPVSLVDGAAVIESPALATGTNRVTVEYSGDLNFRPGTATIEQVVAPILPEPKFVEITREGSHFITIRFQGTPGWRYTVQATTNLAHPVLWEAVATNTVTTLDGTWTFTDDMTLHPQRFFRAVNAGQN